jgi:hypothetical protein
MTATGSTVTVHTKTRVIDKYLSESPVKAPSSSKERGAFEGLTATLWPEEDESLLSKKKVVEHEEDLYGYGDAAPTPRQSGDGVTARLARRSSLKSSDTGTRRASIGYTGEMTLVLPSGETKNKRTSITFAENSDVREVEPISDLVDNPNRLWFQSSEYEYIQAKIYEMIDVAKTTKKSEDRPTWVCMRGLEPVLDSEIAASRQEASGMVLDEQRMQKAHKKFDAEYIRDMYRFHTVESQERAQERAAKDAEEVAEYLKVTRRMCRRMSC